MLMRRQERLGQDRLLLGRKDRPAVQLGIVILEGNWSPFKTI